MGRHPWPASRDELPDNPSEVLVVRLDGRWQPGWPTRHLIQPVRNLGATHGYYTTYQETIESYALPQLTDLNHGPSGEVVSMVVSFIASGLIGNAAYDAVKAGIHLVLAQRDGKQRTSQSSARAALQAREIIADRWPVDDPEDLHLVAENQDGDGCWYFEFEHGNHLFSVRSLTRDGAAFRVRRVR